MELGELTLHLLPDGRHAYDGGGLFGLVPKALWEQVHRPDEENCLDLETLCLLIQAPGQCLLVDTGSGSELIDSQSGRANPQERGHLTKSLMGVGMGPTDIDMVIHTHLHRHHCGGSTRRDENGAIVPAFPKATYYIQRLELADASFPNERTRCVYMRERFVPVERAGQLRVISGDARLSDHVKVMVAPGHTRSHQCVAIESAGRTALFLGDTAILPVHMERLAWVPAYDVEPLLSIETKRKLARWAVEKHALLIFGHRHEVEAGYLYPTDRADRFRLEPVELGS